MEMKKHIAIIIVTTCLAAALQTAGMAAQKHPSLLLTPQGVAEIRAGRGTNAAFDATLATFEAEAARDVTRAIVVPQPLDGGGGYSHEQHKENYYAMYRCGVAYQLTGDGRYADHVERMLLEYARLYPALPVHPVKLSPTPGRLFWQTLNEFVWLVHTSVAYDCVYDHIKPETRKTIEAGLFRPMVRFLTEGTPRNKETFNRMHNHGTWAMASVGMISYVMGDSEMTRKALYGTDMTGKNGGFIKQLGELFSPDGYFTEGPYYHRYAIWPFVVFAQAVDNNQPELKIFEYRSRILEKALYALLQMSYDGKLFMLNDALEKSLGVQELVFATDIIYKSNPAGNKQLLDIASRYQSTFLPTDAGYAVARDIARGQAEPLKLHSVLLRDGANGDQGGVAVLRSKLELEGNALVFKATSHGLSHGHYDKLTFAYYDNHSDVVRDYGAARFVNVEAKYKGHYTPENKTFAMTTIAHNTVTVDGRSHFDGKYDVSSRHAPQIYLYDDSRPGVQIVSAKESNACPGVEMHRTMVMAEAIAEHPVIIDLFRLESDGKHTYDLPLYFGGQIVSVNYPYERALTEMQTLGTANGYQHLWRESVSRLLPGRVCFTWLAGDRFYSMNTLAGEGCEMFFARTGASDPDFNLRSEQCHIVRQKDASRHLFVSTIESHGKYDLVVEQTSAATSSIAGIETLADTREYTVVRITMKSGVKATLMLANDDPSASSHHNAGGYMWDGAYDLQVEIEMKN